MKMVAPVIRDFHLEVLRYFPPTKVTLLARNYMMVELADRRIHQPLLSEMKIEVTTPSHSNEKKSVTEPVNFDDLNLILAWRILQFRGVLFFVFITGAILEILYFFRVLPNRLKSPISEIELAINDAANSVKNPNSIFNLRTIDEIEAEKAIADNQEHFQRFMNQYPNDTAVTSYLTFIREKALDLGQRWAEVEDTYRRAKAQEDRAESFLRAGFLVRAFGFGTVRLIRQLSVILIIGMSIPWIASYFRNKEVDFQTLHNIIWGVGWTFLLWAVTLGVTLFFNDKRMKDTWKRAHLASLRADSLRARETAKLLADCHESTYLLMMILYPKNEANPDNVFIYRLLQSIDGESKEHELRHKELESTIRRLTKKLTTREKIALLIDTGSQGDVFDA